MSILGKTCPLTKNPCSVNCAWCRAIAPNKYECLFALLVINKQAL